MPKLVFNIRLKQYQSDIEIIAQFFISTAACDVICIFMISININ